MVDNIYTLANKIKHRLKLMNSQKQPSLLSKEQLQLIKKLYPLPQWGLQIAKREYQLGYLDGIYSEYLL